MEKITTVTSNVAYLDQINIDTDIIIPKQFLKTITKSGLGQYAFFDIRYDDNENPIPNFIYNLEEYKNSQILVTGKNFGCGSSREHAAWSLNDLGVKVILAESYSDIFYNNAIKNGILPIVLNEEEVAKVMHYAKTQSGNITVNLENQIINLDKDGVTISFDINPKDKEVLLHGYDDIALTLKHDLDITQFEEELKFKKPWV